jgi:hypothetical protein
VLKEHKVIQVI